MIQIIPILIIAPAYMAGRVEFGVITQSAAAFSTAVAAFSLVVTQFQSISSFAAVLARLSSMAEAFEGAQTASSTIQIVESEGPVAYEGLTLSSPTERDLLLENLSATIPFGSRVLVTGANTSAGIALFSATAGDWAVGKGRVVRPRAGHILFLAQKPYLPPGSLRQALAPAGSEDKISDDRITSLVRELNLDHVISQAGGLDAHQNWGTISLRDQQLLAFLHVFLSAPRVVFMDRLRATLTSNEVRQILGMLTAASIGYVSNGEADDCRDLCDSVLDCKEGGRWTWTTSGSAPFGAGPIR
jgi:putative ATP-binding cassette transporter